MQIQFSPSVLVAQSVLAILTNLLHQEKYTKEDGESKGYIQCYQNGREQGYSVTNATAWPTKSVTFCEDRRSDSIVVYLDSKANQGLDEEAYNDRRYSFSYNEFYKAAEFCAAHLLAPVESKV